VKFRLHQSGFDELLPEKRMHPTVPAGVEAPFTEQPLRNIEHGVVGPPSSEIHIPVLKEGFRRMNGTSRLFQQL